MQDKIFIKGLALEAFIGLYEHEKLQKQPIIVDVEFVIDARKAARSGNIADTVDYDLLVNHMTKIVTESRFELLESLIEYMTESLLNEFNLEQVSCTLYKPNAINNAKTVGISITRYQQSVI